MTAAIIVPYRHRAAHLRQFIAHMTPRLHAINNAQIIIVEQADSAPFNRAKLLNIGYLSTVADYFIFHDVDMLPMRADYSYPDNPTHIATRCSQFRYKMPFKEYFGGVTMFNHADFLKVNGYSNKFWSWGGEDNEMYNNVIACGLQVTHRNCTFESLWHKSEDRSLYDENCALLKAGRQYDDGLNNCKFQINKTENYAPGIKKISADLLPQFTTARKV